MRKTTRHLKGILCTLSIPGMQLDEKKMSLTVSYVRYGYLKEDSRTNCVHLKWLTETTSTKEIVAHLNLLWKKYGVHKRKDRYRKICGLKLYQREFL